MPLLNRLSENWTVTESEGRVHLQHNGEAGSANAVQAAAAWKVAAGDSTVYYYEIAVKSTADAVAIGLASDSFPIDKALPGWSPQSYGYHCDDGQRFSNGGTKNTPFPLFGGGDVAGLGLKASTGEIFATLNGELLGVIDIINEAEGVVYYPTVGVNAPSEFEIIFAKADFKFDTASLPDSLVSIFGPLEKTEKFSPKSVILFLGGIAEQTEKDKLINELQKSAAATKAQYGAQSFYGEQDGERAKRFAKFVGLHTQPALVFIDTEKKKNYVLADVASLTSERISEFVQQTQEGKVPAHVKSAPRPPNDRNAAHPSIFQVVTTSFDELVINNSKDVFLDVYADWCGPCVAVAPTIAELADLFADNDNIVIAKLDCDVNEPNRTYLPETSIPNMKLFPASNKSKPAKYEGDRSLASFVEFIHANATTKFDLEAAKAKAVKVSAERAKKELKNVKPVHSTEEFNEHLKATDKLVIVDFFATWCPPCKFIAPVFADFSEEFSAVTFLKVNVDELAAVSQEQGISCMPTFKAYKNGAELGKVEGASAKDIRALITANI